ncbi:hypothetical protein BUALT_Bualt12G0098200 [Buddleja alternifolia]|uniref:Protein kinase domain-containing protein n=1 Tax=Buddleja alternifolia TaxID=168488 RepID=A0AAV6WUT3_9LAMI|nr:hypothetical protein BUALT_Bualt12G0098200 [Buddleja alternifolia]
MKSKLCGCSGRQADANSANDENYGDKCMHNISVQTGEEFSPEFLRDRIASRRMPFMNDVDQSPKNKPVFDVVQNHNLVRRDPESGTELSDFFPSKGYGILHMDCKTYLDSPSGPPIFSSDSPNSYHQPYNNRESRIPENMKFLCSFGGRILPRPNDGKLRYVGGDTKIISIRRNLNYSELVKKTAAICNQHHTIKYQLPGEDLDALISVSSDEDLHHMIEEYHDLERSSQRLRLFLVSSGDLDGPSSSEARNVQQSDSDYHYVVAVNRMPHKSSSRESAASQLGSPQLPSNSYMNDNEDILDGYKNNSPYNKNPYCVNATGYYNYHPIDTAPFVAERSPQGITEQQQIAHEKYQISRIRDQFSQETPNLNKDYIEWGSDTIKGMEKTETSLDQDMNNSSICNDYALDANFMEHKRNLPRIICHPDSNRVPTPVTQVNQGKNSASSSNYTQVWKELPRDYQISPNEPEFLIKSQEGSIDQKLPNKPKSSLGLDLSHHLSFHEIFMNDALEQEFSGHKAMENDFYDRMARDAHGSVSRERNCQEELNIRNDTFINCHKTHMPEIPVIVEDVTDTVPPGDPSSSAKPHIQGGHNVYGIESHGGETETETETVIYESEDDVEDGDDNKDESISDAAIIEMEAGIYGLQIIKNADLEDLQELGSGTFGTVYHGKWRGTDVAIKRIKKSCFAGRSSEQERLNKDFWREAKILSRLHHPNVVAFYGVVPDGPGGTFATVTEYMANGSLRRVLLKKDRALDRRKKVIIALDAAFGMEYLHLKNIVHFDLKCDNLLVNLGDPQRPVCKVGDFGLSRIKQNTLVSGGVRGTLPWMAPELLSGGSNRVSEKVDVFSFGVAMWELLTGEEPYANMHCGAIIGGIVNNTLRPPIPERCDPEWRKMMEECWSHDPGARPSFTEITNRLRVISATLQPKRFNRVRR